MEGYEEYTYQDSSPLLTLVIIVVAVAVLAIAGYMLLAAPASEHASSKHPEAEGIRKCLEQNGPTEIWKFVTNKRPNHYIMCAQLDDGSWGLQICQLTKGCEWIEKTAFKVKNGTKFDLIEYVSARAVRIFGGG